ncbi:MAG: QueT transporter family protein [Oscillospiraceae bacterium]|nr:QueT transporter family protein [Oscillospiraceae bacterium]
MKFTVKRIAFAGVLAALYAVITILEGWLAQNLAYGAIQFRFAEALSVLCCFTPAAIPGMVLGCAVSNFFNPFGFAAVDIVFGSLATLLAGLITWKMARHIEERHSLVWLVPLPTILCNAVIVGAEIAIFFDKSATLHVWLANALSVGIGEAGVMYALGIPLLLSLLKGNSLCRDLRAI